MIHNGVHLDYIPKDCTAEVKSKRIDIMRIVTIEPASKWSEVIIESV